MLKLNADGRCEVSKRGVVQNDQELKLITDERKQVSILVKKFILDRFSQKFYYFSKMISIDNFMRIIQNLGRKFRFR